MVTGSLGICVPSIHVFVLQNLLVPYISNLNMLDGKRKDSFWKSDPTSGREEHRLSQFTSDDVLGQRNEVTVATLGLDRKATTIWPSYSASFPIPQIRGLYKSQNLPVTLECGFLLWPSFPCLWVLPGMPSRILSIHLIRTQSLCISFLTPAVPTESGQAAARHSSLPLQYRVLLHATFEFLCPMLFSQLARASCCTPNNN